MVNENMMNQNPLEFLKECHLLPVASLKIQKRQILKDAIQQQTIARFSLDPDIVILISHIFYPGFLHWFSKYCQVLSTDNDAQKAILRQEVASERLHYQQGVKPRYRFFFGSPVIPDHSPDMHISKTSQFTADWLIIVKGPHMYSAHGRCRHNAQKLKYGASKESKQFQSSDP